MDIIKKYAPINVIVYNPETEKGKRELKRRVASIHADMVGQYIRKLDCPSWQKDNLIDAIVKTVSKD